MRFDVQRILANLLLAAGAFVMAAGTVRAHNPDTSYARFRIDQDRSTATFTYDVTSLLLLDEGLDANGDRSLVPAELTAAVPRIEALLRRSISLEIDGEPADLGTLGPVDWPAESGPVILEKDYHAPRHSSHSLS